MNYRTNRGTALRMMAKEFSAFWSTNVDYSPTSYAKRIPIKWTTSTRLILRKLTNFVQHNNWQTCASKINEQMGFEIQIIIQDHIERSLFRSGIFSSWFKFAFQVKFSRKKSFDKKNSPVLWLPYFSGYSAHTSKSKQASYKTLYIFHR